METKLGQIVYYDIANIWYVAVVLRVDDNIYVDPETGERTHTQRCLLRVFNPQAGQAVDKNIWARYGEFVHDPEQIAPINDDTDLDDNSSSGIEEEAN